MPTQNYLHVRLVILCRKLREQFFADQPAVYLDDRVPAFKRRAVRSNPLLQLALLEVRVAFNLQHRRFYFCSSAHFLKPRRLEVAQTDCANLSFFHRLFHVAPGTYVVAELLMQQKQIDVVSAQTRKHFVDGTSSFPFAIFARPQFARNPDVAPFKAALLYSASHTAFVLIRMSRIDMPIPKCKRIKTCFLCRCIAVNLKHTESELRNLRAVIQWYIRLIHNHLLKDTSCSSLQVKRFA